MNRVLSLPATGGLYCLFIILTKVLTAKEMDFGGRLQSGIVQSLLYENPQLQV